MNRASQPENFIVPIFKNHEEPNTITSTATMDSSPLSTKYYYYPRAVPGSMYRRFAALVAYWLCCMA
ncbi:hypothetical protein J6590_096356 [Homalodisca vitripennis]|nr:hypothetical protein J6590_096356 [Homalodisca vitripennis]